MKSVEKIAAKKQESRDIVNKILEFGVTEDQKIDIMYFLALNLEDNNRMKKICELLNKYKSNINNEEKQNNNKIILS